MFIGIIALIFGYAVIFSPDSNNYPIHSQHDRFTQSTSKSTGMSRAFSLVVRGRISAARAMNAYSIQLIAFFLLQLGMRIFLLVFLATIKDFDRKMVVTVDAITSIGLFVLLFEPFIKESLGIN